MGTMQGRPSNANKAVPRNRYHVESVTNGVAPSPSPREDTIPAQIPVMTTRLVATRKFAAELNGENTLRSRTRHSGTLKAKQMKESDKNSFGGGDGGCSGDSGDSGSKKGSC